MSRRMVPMLFVILAASSLVAPTFAGESEVSVLLGGKSFSDTRLAVAGIDETSQFGLKTTLDFDWPVSLAIDVLWAEGDSTVDASGVFPLSVKTEMENLELDFGVRKYFFDTNPVRLYVGGGVAFAKFDVKQVESGSFGPGASFSDVIVDDSNTAVGCWVDGGFGYFVKKVVLGLDLRYSYATTSVTPAAGSDLDLDISGLQYAFFMGFRW